MFSVFWCQTTVVATWRWGRWRFTSIVSKKNLRVAGSMLWQNWRICSSQCPKSDRTACSTPLIKNAALHCHYLLWVTLNPNPIICVVISISSLPLLIPPLQTERSKLPDGRINEFVVDGYNKSVIFWGEKHFFLLLYYFWSICFWHSPNGQNPCCGPL